MGDGVEWDGLNEYGYNVVVRSLGSTAPTVRVLAAILYQLFECM